MASPSLPGPADFRGYLVAKAAEVAPADVAALVAQRDRLRARARREAPAHLVFHRRLELALTLLDDHVAGRCPQIPYQTVGVLAAALFYYLAPVDVVPDFIAAVGTSDDALVLEIAFGLGAPGIERYLAWKDIRDPALVPRTEPARAAPHRRTAPRRRR
jgi:uncharacterized membrane protein YkvA (DUF1232 family)